MKTTVLRPVAITFLAIAPVAMSTGCKSSNTSRWAWNPWSKSANEQAAALAESSPKLPSDGATPLIEGLDAGKKTAVAVATPSQTPPAMAGLQKTMETVAAATPVIQKPAPSSPNWTPYPTATSGTGAGTTPKPPTTAVASAPTSTANPYDPNGYKPAEPVQVASNTDDRYGLGDRYAATPTAGDSNPFGELPPMESKPASNLTGDRYGASPSTAAVAAASASSPPETSPGYPSTGTRYPSTDASPSESEVAQTANPVESSRYPVTTPSLSAPPEQVATSVSTPPATPAYPSTNPAATAATETPEPAVAQATSPYPTTQATAVQSETTPTYPVASSPVLGTLPTDSVYGAKTSPVEPAVASTPANESPAIRLTTLPGEYRPGGTSTYQPSVSVATRPEESETPAPANSRY